MSRNPQLDPHRPNLEKFVTKIAERMDESAFVLTLFTKDYKNGIDSMLQFSLAVMLNKPIFFLVPNGVEVPEKVMRIADGVEYYDQNDQPSFAAATERLLRKAREKGFAA